MRARFARHTHNRAETVRFYWDGLGLPEIGSFHDYDGYDGVFLELPGTGAHLEFTSGGFQTVGVPVDLAAQVAAPTLIMSGGASYPFMRETPRR